MKYFNIYYIIAVITGVVIVFAGQWMGKETLFFYGFAENKETEINFNYPVVVDEILVSPGQKVQAGEPLLKLKRVKAKERLDDQGYRIEEMQAKVRAWRSEQDGKLRLAEAKKQQKISELDAEIQRYKEERRFKSSLFEGLSSIDTNQQDYTPLTDKIRFLEQEKELAVKSADLEIRNLKNELRLGTNPYEVEINRLRAEQKFEADNKVIEVLLRAPSDGVIGNVYCKRAEHIPSFKTLIIFYEPNPTQVKGYVHEEQILEIGIKDSVIIRSTKDEQIFCKGIVTGMGSRIVEIPDRLRKIPDLKTYGREVLLNIPSDNNFLQKEKVGLEVIEK